LVATGLRTIAAVPGVEQPSSPIEELAARGSWRGPTLANGVLTAELAEFFQSGVSVVIAGRDDRGWPVVGRGVACKVDGSGQVRVLIRKPSNVALLTALEGGSGIAVTFTMPSTHRSIQVKASSVRFASLTATDRVAAAEQVAAFRADLVRVGYAADFAAGYTSHELHGLAAVEFLPEHAFVQTPGPSAGSALQP
jgi:hypothetical protein